jgi:hypothetical protein
MEYLGLYNKLRAEVHPGHKLMGPIKEGHAVCVDKMKKIY